MEDLRSEIEVLMTRYSILKNEDIKNILIETLSKYTDFKEDYVVLDVRGDETNEKSNTYILSPEEEDMLDETLDEIELEDRGTQTNCIRTNTIGISTNNSRIDDCNCERCKDNIFHNMADDFDRTFKNISYGIDEIGNFIGDFIDGIIEDT